MVNFIISRHSGSGFSEKGINEALHRIKEEFEKLRE